MTPSDVVHPTRCSPILRIQEVCLRTSLSSSHLYALIGRQAFPAFIPLAPRARGLPEHHLDAWLASRIAARAAMSSLRDPVHLPPWTPSMALAHEGPSGIRMLRLRDVERRVGLRKSHLYRAIGQQAFPAPVPLSEYVRRWVAHEVDDWLARCLARSLRSPDRRTALVAHTPSP